VDGAQRVLTGDLRDPGTINNRNSKPTKGYAGVDE
jgi:hypothetical protein